MKNKSKYKKEPSKKLKPRYRFWLETEEEWVFGQGAFKLLKGIQEKGSLSGSAKALGMSYRYAWGIIKQIEKKMGVSVLKTYTGGTSGGGSTLTQIGKDLMDTYLKYKKAFDQICLKTEEN